MSLRSEEVNRERWSPETKVLITAAFLLALVCGAYGLERAQVDGYLSFSALF